MTVNWQWCGVYGSVVATTLGGALVFGNEFRLWFASDVLTDLVGPALVVVGMLALTVSGIRAARRGELRPAPAAGAIALGLLTVLLWVGPVFNGVSAGLCTAGHYPACRVLDRRPLRGPIAKWALKNRRWIAHECVVGWDPEFCRRSVELRILQPVTACAHVPPYQRAEMAPYCSERQQRPRFIW